MDTTTEVQRATATPPIRIILLATDRSECAEHARRAAHALCRDRGARLVVLYVAPSQVVYASPVDGSMHARPDLAAIESRLREAFEDGPDAGAETHAREGEPTATIVAFADEVRADLIVMGATGGGGCGRFQLGSVAYGVIRKAHCPVMTVKGPAPPEAPSAPSTLERAFESPAARPGDSRPLRA